MFQTHCYDSWLGGAARKSTFFMWSQVLGTLPAPLFLFLAGISFAIVTDKLRQKGLLRVDILNSIGVSMILMGMLMGLGCWIVLSLTRISRPRLVLGLMAAGMAAVI